jgi:acyl-homoserine lactone acylase PvdQ
MNTRTTGLSLAIALLIAGLLVLAGNGPPGVAARPIQVAIYRDEYGVPHIYGETAAATAYGFGYAQAQDHIEAMRKDFYSATGRMAEFFGAVYVNYDLASRLLHIPETATATYAALTDDHRARIDGFAAGINLYIDENTGSLPSWVLPVEPEEILAWLHFGSIMEEYQHAGAELQAWLGGSAPEGEPSDVGSNMWVVGQGKSAIDAPILHGDPHLAWTGWTQWYEAHLSYPGVNVAGATFFGYPGIAMGANDFMTWSMTDNSPDTADVYIESLNPFNLSQYLYDSQWLPLESEVVTIKVAGSSDRVFTNYYTHHGPVIASETAMMFAAAMSTFEDAAPALEIFNLNDATSISQAFPGDMVPHTPKWNIIAADDAGNIFYLYNIRVAHKSEAYDWSRPLDGSMPATDWGTFLTLAELPQVTNPASEYLQNANNPPWSTAPELDPEDYPSYLGQGTWLGDRGTRVVELMESQGAFTVEDIKATGLDDLSVLARSLTPLLLEAWADLGSTWPDPEGRLAAAIALIEGWDYRGRIDSPVYALFRLWVADFWVLRPSFGASDVPPVGSVSQADQEKMLTALEQATSFMMTNFGRLDPAWGDVHKMKRGATLSLHLGGGNSTLASPRMTSISSFSNGVWWATYGSSYLFVAALTDPVEFWSVRPLGESEDPASPHYADVTALYSANQYKRLWMTLADVQAHQESVIVLAYGTAESVGGVADLPEIASDPSGPDASTYALFAGGAILLGSAVAVSAYVARRRAPGARP